MAEESLPAELPKDHAVEFTLDLMSVFEDVLQVEDVAAGSPCFISDRVNSITLQRLVGAVDETYRSSRFLKAVDCLGPMPTNHLQSTGIGFTDDFEQFVKLGFLFADRVVLWNAIIDGLLTTATDIDVDLLGLQVCQFLAWRPIAEDGGLVLLPHPSRWLGRYQYYAGAVRHIRDLGNDFWGLLNARALLEEGFDLHPFATPESPIFAAMHAALVGNEDKFLPAKVEQQNLALRLLNERRLELLYESNAVPFFRAMKDIARDARLDLRKRLAPTPGLSAAEREEHLNAVVSDLGKVVESQNAAVRRHAITLRANAVGLAGSVPPAVGATVAVLAGNWSLGAILGLLSTALAAPYVRAWTFLDKLSSRPSETVLFKLFRRLETEQRSYDDEQQETEARQVPRV